MKVVDEASAAEAARVRKGRGVGHVIVTMGSAGCWCEGMHPSVPVKAVDTTAAGDTFNGAFVAALCEGRAVDDALAFASKAAAISVTRPGAQSSVPYRREV